jgi:lipopolysaccharide export system protein LptA
MITRSGWLALLLLLLPLAAESQQQRSCNIAESERITREEFAGVAIITLHGPFRIVCNDGAVLRASSGVVNETSRDVTLTGNVFFQDPEQVLTAQQAFYNTATGRLHALGSVVFTNRTEGSTLRGPELEYYRALPERPEALVIAPQRPRLTLQPRQGGADGEPMELDADHVVIRGNDDLHARGSVVITRSDMRAVAGEARYNGDTEALELREAARITSDDYELAGELVNARLREGAMEHLRARTDAALTGEDLRVTAADLELFFENERLQRTFARMDPAVDAAAQARPVALARTFRLEADSIEAVTPDQRLEQVIALGAARGETIDTLRVQTEPPAGSPAPGAAARLALLENDWIRGDTVIGYFVPRAPGAEASGAEDAGVTLQRLLARGAAQSLYRAAPEGDEANPENRGINYLSGAVIELTFEDGELQVAEVQGLRRGLYLEPEAAGGRRAAPAAGQAPAGARPGGVARR